MKLKKYSLVILSILILLVFVSSASAADVNETDVLSVDESTSVVNEKLALDNKSDMSVSNDSNVLENDNDEKLALNPSSDIYAISNDDDILGKYEEHYDFPETIEKGKSAEFNFRIFRGVPGEYQRIVGPGNAAITIGDFTKTEHFKGAGGGMEIEYDESIGIFEGVFTYDTDSGSDHITHKFNITVHGPTWYVDGNKESSGDGKNPETAFKTLNEAVNACSNDEQIMIASGEYKGTDNINLEIEKRLSFIKYGDGDVIFDAEGLSRIWTVDAKSINITGLTFKNGKADGNSDEEKRGGAIYINKISSTSTITATFINNTATGDGGAIYIEGDVSGNLNANFNNNKATGDGGAIYIKGDVSGNIDGSFSNNTADSGGAIYIEDDISGNIGGSFSNNIAEHCSAIMCHGLSGNLRGGVFINNTPSKDGGAIYIKDDGSDLGDIKDSVFIDNNKNAIETNFGNITATNCWFGNNATNYNIKPTNIGNITIDTWLFLNAIANPTRLNINETSTITFKLDSYDSSSGDVNPYDASKMEAVIKLTKTLGDLDRTNVLIGQNALYTARQEGNSSVTGKAGTAFYTVNLKNGGSVINTWYINISAPHGGDGSKAKPFNVLKDALNIAHNDDTIMFASGTYTGENYINLEINKPLSFTKYGDSETIFDAEESSRIWTVTATSINITGLTFKNGKADNGGAIYFTNTLVNSNINATFEYNKADNGGAIYANSLSNSNINAKFINNTADNGGAIYNNGYYSGNISSIFINNTVNYFGGAIYNNGYYSGNITSTFINNRATQYRNGCKGGAILIEDSFTGNLTSTFINNSAEHAGAVAIWNGFSGNLRSIFINNSAKKGGAIGFFECGNVVFQESIFINNNNTLYNYYGEDNITVINCWFGNTVTNYNSKPETVDINLDKWLFLNGTANPTELKVGETSTITFKLDSFDSTTGLGYQYNASKMGAILEISQTQGELNKNTSLIGEEVLYTAKNIGDASVTGKFETVSYTINLKNTEPTDTEIIIKTDSISLHVGENTSAGASVEPKEGGTLIYKSNDENIVTVDKNGKITAKNNGTTTITVSLNPNPGYKEAQPKNITITVEPTDTEIIIKTDSISLYVGENTTVEASVEPNDGGTLIYKSNDENIVTVDKNGKITAKNNGTTTITVSLNPNPGYNEAQPKNITITVEPKKDLNLTGFVFGIGNTITIIVMGFENATGNVTITVNANTYTTSIKNSRAIVSMPKMSKNTTAYIYYPGDNKYNNITTTVEIHAKQSLNITATADSITVGENANVIVTELENATGNVSVTIDDITYYGPIINGTATVIIPGLKNNVTGTVNYAGDGTYYATFTSIDIVVYRNNLNISATADPITVGDNATVKVMGLENATGNVSVTIDDNIYYGPIINGTATVIIPGLKNNVTGTVNYAGDDTYYATFTTIDIVVYRNNLNITATADPITVGDNATVKVTGLKDATGEVKVIIDGKEWTGEISKGTAEVIITGLKETVTAEVLYPGDEKYNNASTTVDISVKKDLNLTGFVFGMGNTIYIIVMDFENATGNVTITVNANTYTTSIKNSRAIVSMPKMSENTTAYIYYPGDDKYNNASTTVDIHVKKALNITATADPITVGDNATVIVTGLENATGNVSVTIDDNVYYGSIINGTATVIVQGLKNNVTATVNYDGDDIYYATFTTIDIVVYRKNLKITAIAVPITVGDNATVKITGLKDATGEVKVVINGKEWTGEISKGTAKVIITGLKETVTAEVLYPGDEKYNNASTTVDIVVNPVPVPDKKNLTISANVDPITVGENATVKVTGLENATGNIFVIVNGKIYVVPIKNGEATLTVAGLTENVTAIVNYIGDATYNPTFTIVNITVNPKIINIDAPNVVKYFSGPERFIVNVTNSKGTPLSNKTVFITINGRTYNRTTDENGIASLGLNLHSGIYNVVSAVDNQTVISLVTILPTVNGTDVVKMYKNDTQYYATFRDSKGNYLADGTTVKFNINGVMYERKVSGDKGLAKLNINLPAGEYIITAINPETREMAANRITVLSKIVENSDLTKYYRNDSQFVVKIIGEDGKAVAGENVTFNINGVFYTRTTNATGHAKLNINLGPGDYIITAEYKGCKVSNNIAVLPVLYADDLTKQYGTPDPFEANLVDGQGKPYENQKVEFNINGVLYHRKTDSNGIVRLNINMRPGEYIITSSYNGVNIANTIRIVD